jgi:hypothetical protein
VFQKPKRISLSFLLLLPQQVSRHPKNLPVSLHLTRSAGQSWTSLTVLDPAAENVFCDAVYRLMSNQHAKSKLKSSKESPLQFSTLVGELRKLGTVNPCPYGPAPEARRRGLKVNHEILQGDSRFVVFQDSLQKGRPILVYLSGPEHADKSTGGGSAAGGSGSN